VGLKICYYQGREGRKEEWKGSGNGEKWSGSREPSHFFVQVYTPRFGDMLYKRSYRHCNHQRSKIFKNSTHYKKQQKMIQYCDVNGKQRWAIRACGRKITFTPINRGNYCFKGKPADLSEISPASQPTNMLNQPTRASQFMRKCASIPLHVWTTVCGRVVKYNNLWQLKYENTNRLYKWN